MAEGHSIAEATDAAAPAVTRPAPQKQYSVLAAAVAGFFCGAACWHLIGFWSLVSEAVFNARGDGDRAVVSKPPARAQGRTAGAAFVPPAPNCTTVERDQTGAGIRLRECTGSMTRLRPPSGLGRADLADFGPQPVPTVIGSLSGEGDRRAKTAVEGWSARIEATTTVSDRRSN